MVAAPSLGMRFCSISACAYESFSGIMLKCGQHACPSKCHQLADHSRMSCEQITNKQCLNGHNQQWKCSRGPPNSCAKCERERELAEKKRREQFALQAKRDAEEQAHARQMAEIEAQVTREREKARAAREAEERKRALEQKRLDLQAAQAQARYPVPVPPPTQSNSIFQTLSSYILPWGSPASPAPPPSSAQTNIAGKTQVPPKVMLPTPSAARDEWQHQKSVNGVQNSAIDAIMAMTGLEDVKKQVLSIRNKVDTSMRQGTDLKGERFNVSMLGDPGTGAPIIGISPSF